MARFITLFLFILTAISGFIMYRQQDVGFLIAGIGDYKFETTLLIAGITALFGIIVLLILLKALGLLHKIFLYFGANRETRLAEKARNALSLGLIELAEGRFAQAEKLLLKQVKHNDNALLAYLAAARAAQQLGEHERRDDYLSRAHEITPSAEIAIGLTKAELQIEHEQYEQALANLNHLHEIAPKHAFVIKLLVKTYRHLSDWKNLQALLADIKNLKIIKDEKLHALELETWQGLLDEQAHCKDLASLIIVWDMMPASLKNQTQLIEYYAHLLIDVDACNQAEQLLRQHLHSNWIESTLALYSQLDVSIDNHHIEQVESWLIEHQHNALLLLALGKFCFNNKLWGKSRSYLEASLSTLAMPQTYLKLAQLLEQYMDEPELAQKNYQLGLECFADKNKNTVSFVSDDIRSALQIAQ